MTYDSRVYGLSDRELIDPCLEVGVRDLTAVVDSLANEYVYLNDNGASTGLED